MLPVLYQNPEFTLYAYPLFMGIGWGVGYQFYLYGIADTIGPLKRLITFWGIFLSAWIGAKLLFILSASTELPKELVRNLSFWMGGGFVFYGGFLGALIFLLCIHRWWDSLSMRSGWSLLLGLAFGHAVGRIGCFLAGCCFGAPTELPWAIHLHGQGRHPTQILEALALVTLGGYLLKSRKPKVILILRYVWFYGTIRFLIEFLRGDQIRGQWGPLTPSQWISLGFMALVLIVAKVMKRRSAAIS